MNRIVYRNALCLTTAALAAAAVPAHAEVYLTESQAIGVILGDKAVVSREQKALDAELRRKLEQSSNLRFPESSFNFFIATQGAKPAKYAIVMNEIGKTEPITFMVGLSPEGKVTEVVIMEFRENRGWEVKEKRFLNQFRGKSAKNPVRVDEDIINYTGATLSSKAVARGVKKALLLLDAFYPGESRTTLGVACDFAQPAALMPLSRTSQGHGELALFRQVRYAMGTQCELRVWCGSLEESRTIFAGGFGELERLEQIFSSYRDDSELAFVNRNAAASPVEVSRDFFEATARVLTATAKTDGVVDITAGPLLRAWGIPQSEARIPSEQEIASAKSKMGIGRVLLNKNERTIQFAQNGLELDFGGIAKGYAAQKVAARLEELGAASALVNLGRSSLCASHVLPDFTHSRQSTETSSSVNSWPVAITHPGGMSSPPLNLFLEPGQSLSTSGTGERNFTADGKEFSHILNAKTGQPLSGVRSATVIAQNGIECEVASKELLLLDRSERENLAQKRSLLAWARFDLDQDRVLHKTIFPAG